MDIQTIVKYHGTSLAKKILPKNRFGRFHNSPNSPKYLNVPKKFVQGLLHKYGFKIIEKIIDMIKHEKINNIFFLKFSLTIKV